MSSWFRKKNICIEGSVLSLNWNQKTLIISLKFHINKFILLLSLSVSLSLYLSLSAYILTSLCAVESFLLPFFWILLRTRLQRIRSQERSVGNAYITQSASRGRSFKTQTETKADSPTRFNYSLEEIRPINLVEGEICGSRGERETDRQSEERVGGRGVGGVRRGV